LVFQQAVHINALSYQVRQSLLVNYWNNLVDRCYVVSCNFSD